MLMKKEKLLRIKNEKEKQKSIIKRKNTKKQSITPVEDVEEKDKIKDPIQEGIRQGSVPLYNSITLEPITTHTRAVTGITVPNSRHQSP